MNRIQRRLMQLMPRLILWGSLISAVIVLPLYAFKVYAKTDYTDFFVYYRSALRLKEHSYSEIYTLTDGASPFRYIPLLLPIFRPFAEVPLKAAQLLWYAFQYISFALGFLLLHRVARRIEVNRAAWATHLTFLFILRFCLDAFTIGQVSSLMFFGYCLAFYGFVAERDFLGGAGLVIPTFFKIGPGFSYLIFPFVKLNRCIRAWVAPPIVAVAMSAITLLMLGSFKVFSIVHSDWLNIVTHDDDYYDASHYGSQALKSVLLRLSNAGWISHPHVYLLWGILAVIGCSGILWIWATRRAQTAMGNGLLFSLGVFPYLWFMPETFKYSLTTLALPVLMLWISRDRSKLRRVALVFGIFTLSLAGKDFLPDSIFFGLQRASVPFLATLLIAAANVQLLWKNTLSHKGRWHLPRPWEELPPSQRPDRVSVLIPIGSRFPSRASLNAVDDLQKRLTSKFDLNWEIIWISEYATSVHTDLDVVNFKKLAERFPKGKVIHTAESGRGHSLREGFLRSSGEWIYLYRLEQPVDPIFFEKGIELLKSGYQLVRGNRRSDETRFLIPVKNLSLAFSRHRMGLVFNRLVRLFLPEVKTSDTHSGHILLTRKVAGEVFALQTSGGFLFDLELCVIAQAQNYRESDLPVHLYLFKEKSPDRILAEALSILTGLPRLRFRLRNGCYNKLSPPTGITADDWGLSRAVNHGIYELAREEVVKRVSLMANCSYLTHRLEDLKKIPSITLGIHFNLTYGRPLSPTYKTLPPKQLLFKFLNPFQSSKVKQELIRQIQEELRLQLEVLKKNQVQIAYFDGHHHIHLIPGLLSSVSPILHEYGISTVRVPYDPSIWFSSKFPLNILSPILRHAVLKQGFKTMEAFYPQETHFQDHGKMRGKLNRNPHAEIIVHPASRNDIASLEFPDSYTEGRVQEYRALRMLGYTRIRS
jgi:predicted glycoside hydrolase/deacetylase ChbG (UPF0249 family)